MTAFSAPASKPDDKALVVVLHGYTHNPRSMRHVVRVTTAMVPQAHFLVPSLPLGLFSTAEPIRIARDIQESIEAEISSRAAKNWPPFEEILLIGHSCGALLARKVYLLSGPESEEARFEDSVGDALLEEKPWFPLIRRIILLAGMNRGWSLTHHLNIPRALAMRAGILFGDISLAITGERHTIFRIRKGAPFITELRLQWIALRKQLERDGRNLALTVQLLGTVDDLVAPTDNIDLWTGRDFVYLDVPFSGHANVIEMDDSDVGCMRRAVLEQALSSDAGKLAGTNLPDDLGLPNSRAHVTDVIFVVHGIRDVGYWTQKIARKVEALGNAPPKIYASQTSSYGYFAMIPFLLPSRRRDKVQWLMDQYVEAKALYPDARFSYMGHSNGTYLLAKALRDYRACRFERIVFAGSVVRTDYDWQTLFRRRQAEAVLNYVAAADWVVAFFPGALELLNLQDLGSAGHNGFKQDAPGIFQCKYLRGQHGAALSEANWDDIANFIVAPTPQASSAPYVNRRNRFVVCFGWIAPLIWLGILGIVSVVGWRLPSLTHNEAIQTLLVVGYIWCVWKILTRV